jgi:hypothetical protein
MMILSWELLRLSNSVHYDLDMDNEPHSLRALREAANPRTRRLAAIHPKALTDLSDGHFHLLTNLDEGWSLGLISAASTRTEDLLLAQQAALAGADILRFEHCHMLTLYRSRDLGTPQRWVGADVACISGNRYFLMVLPVDEGDDDYDQDGD